MTAIRIQPAKPEHVSPVRTWLKNNASRVLARHRPGLEQLQDDGCLLIACKAGSGPDALLGVAGVDPEHARISLLASQNPKTLQALLKAAEKLAVSFGMQAICLRLESNPTAKTRLPDSWHESSQAQVLERKLSRRQTRLGRKAAEMHAELGIPADYGCSHRLRLQPEPAELASIGYDVFDREQFMLPKAADALRRMLAQARNSGLAIQPVSAFRSVDYQYGIVRNKLDRGQQIKDILKVSAAPGFSEHHSGRAVDLTSPGYRPLEEEFENSPAYAWLQGHAGDFGFRLSYPKGNRHGVAYEPWHWCYTGR